jgi:UDP-N-acetylmuramoylalanine-D-glutamate ligase
MDARADLYVASLARELRDHETVFVGANQPDVALAAYLARRLWAPRLRIWAAGTAQLDPAMDLAMVGRRTNDRIVLSARGASFHQARAFEDRSSSPAGFRSTAAGTRTWPASGTVPAGGTCAGRGARVSRR